MPTLRRLYQRQNSIKTNHRMLYILNIILSCLYLSVIKEKNTFLFLIKVLPVIFLWVFIVGGQYEIGADYGNYLAFFRYPLGDVRFEALFTGVSRFVYRLGVMGQGQFYIFALINAVVIFIASHKLGIKHWAIFYFLLITVSTFFNNQMNGIRQCTAVAFVYWGFVEFYCSKFKGVALMAVAGGFHFSALINLCFVFFKKITHILTKYPAILLISLCSISLLPSDEHINEYLIEMLPEQFKEDTHYESMYAEDEDTQASTGVVYKLSKLLLLPLYLYSLRLLRNGSLSEKENLFFRFGILSYSLRCALLINNLIGRFSYYFWIPSILPLYYLCVNMHNRKRYVELAFVLIYASAIYFIKVFMGTAEYRSSFIYFQ